MKLPPSWLPQRRPTPPDPFLVQILAAVRDNTSALTAIANNPLTREGTMILAAISQLSKDIKQMSGSVSDQLDAMTVKFQADIDGITAQQADLHAQITTLTAELTPGATITQAQLDKLAAIEATAATLAAPVVVAPPPPAAA